MHEGAGGLAVKAFVCMGGEAQRDNVFFIL